MWMAERTEFLGLTFSIKFDFFCPDVWKDWKNAETFSGDLKSSMWGYIPTSDNARESELYRLPTL